MRVRHPRARCFLCRKASYLFMLISLSLYNLSFAQTIRIPEHFETIQEGIMAAGNGDTVLIKDGRYYENINFLGKPITVASYFIIDGDTSHISGTIIDGSRPVHPDTASTVLMISGEDSTSVLCGLTITGGAGTRVNLFSNWDRAGGGVLIYNSGAKIDRNIIEGNALRHNRGTYVHGGGIYAGLYSEIYHHFICTNNLVRRNIIKSDRAAQGAGIAVAKYSGSVLIHNNTIVSNRITSTNKFRAVHGGGVSVRTQVPETGSVIVSNNIISKNKLLGGERPFRTDPREPEFRSLSGAGIVVVLFETFGRQTDLSPYPLICDNIITDNLTDGRGGGIGIGGYDNRVPGSPICPKPVIIRNTISGNKALEGAAIFNRTGRLLLMDNEISHNISENDGEEILDLKKGIILIESHERLGLSGQKFLRLGNRLLVKSDGNWYRIKGIRHADDMQVVKLPPIWRIWWALTLYGIFLTGGLIWYRNFIVRRERLKLALEMEKFEKEKILELDRMKSRFFENISHEFRTPLTLISGPLEELLENEKIPPEKQVSELKLMFKHVHKLKNLITQLLDLSKLETGSVKLLVKPGNLSEFVNRVVLSFLSLAESKQITYEYDIPRRPDFLFYDEDKLEMILNNLISNAFKFTSPGGTIRVMLDFPGSEEGEYIQDIILTVRDTGKGMSAAEKERIFERFFRVRSDNDEEVEGSGIGLSLVKEMVDLYGGSIEVESEPGIGSTFIVTLPAGKLQFDVREIIAVDEGIMESTLTDLRDTGVIEQEENTVHDRFITEDKTIILIVEDNNELRKYIIRNLNDTYKILEANNGKKGLEIATETIPDLVITDLMMPGIDGIELCRRLKEDMRTGHIPVIMLTARADKESKFESFEKGADAYLIKPFDPHELKIRIHNLIGQRMKLRDHFRKEFLLDPDKFEDLSTEEEFLVKLTGCVQDNLSDESFSVEKLSSAMQMSRVQLYRKIRALTDFSPHEFIRNTRLKVAAKIFREGHKNVSQVMYEVGFSTPSYFTERFRELFGVNPSEYIKNLNSAEAP